MWNEQQAGDTYNLTFNFEGEGFCSTCWTNSNERTRTIPKENVKSLNELKAIALEILVANQGDAQPIRASDAPPRATKFVSLAAHGLRHSIQNVAKLVI